jgi:hypothetical protein
MNFLDIRAGDNLEVGTQLAFRFWRYVFPPFEAPVRLLSWVSSMRWHPGQFVEGTTPDIGRQGIHGYKSMDDLIDSINGDPDNLLFRCKLSETDGVILGTVALWGIIWDHARGYRAQFARPTSFISAHGNRNREALAELSALFFAG